MTLLWRQDYHHRSRPTTHTSATPHEARRPRRLLVDAALIIVGTDGRRHGGGGVYLDCIRQLPATGEPLRAL